MTIKLPEDLEQTIVERAGQLGLTPDEVVRRAVSWYVEIPAELWWEMSQWQNASLRSWQMVEDLLA